MFPRRGPDSFSDPETFDWPVLAVQDVLNLTTQ